MEETFKEAQNYIKNSKKGSIKLDMETQLKFYGLYKQATVGPCNEKAPSRLNVSKRYKWEAHSKLGQMNKKEAMEQFVQLLTELQPNWN